MKIISGGQTGVDRAALDAALECGIAAGGWCPAGRLAEDGPIPAKYPLQELAGAGYPQRTRQNVIDSDGTAIIYFGKPTGGTEFTIRCCVKENRPYLLIDANMATIEQALSRLKLFISQHGIAVLNIAGPRASGEPRAYNYAKQLILALLHRVPGS